MALLLAVLVVLILAALVAAAYCGCRWLANRIHS